MMTSAMLAEVGSGALRLQPDYQRYYIWNTKKEQYFIDSILRGYPIPPIWLWKHIGANKRTIYEVIDGQQRLTCIKKFVDNEFEYNPPKNPIDSSLDKYKGAYFGKPPKPKKKKLDAEAQNRIVDYKINFISLETEDEKKAIDIFKRLNVASTNLNRQELRNAFYKGKFKTEIYDLVATYQKNRFWMKKIFAPPSTDRMGVQQYVSQLFVAMIKGNPLNKYEEVDNHYEDFDKSFRSRKKFADQFNSILKIIKRILTGSSRFTDHLSDFYSLFLLVNEYHLQKDINFDADNINAIRKTLEKFQKDYTAYFDDKSRTGNRLFEDYRETIVGRQREKEMREKRQSILKNLLDPAIKRTKKDLQRSFTREQKNYIWNDSLDKKCFCGSEVQFEDYEPDHIDPWNKGGRSSIANGRVTHSSCNRSRQDKE